ncbi:carbohydrate ABC transporter permease [Myceligenerans xiligouense]|uniref:Carbohydrate ABC transporter membrane protein 2 (CUT1 family) n=1 Tax=Myceligenerans xiligouense TaxID=253184 RepID=A0A3N4YI86_9MICO|nr:carbohydrate ABC transporter permease [Myceligenerans xiligouense]RPF20839.1 carbohydrate ABC transporter membrane protein 2 (CUT1 family) [Myceligenerans xiligouense]
MTTTTLGVPATKSTQVPIRKPAGWASRRVRGIALTTVTWIAVLAFFFPVVWMVFTAFKPESQAATLPPTFAPDFTLDRFQAVFDRDMLPYLINSASASLGSTLLVLALAIPAAYALSVRPVKNVRDPLFFLISTKFMPVAASIIPVYMLLQAVGGLDNITWLTILYVGINLPIAVWMMRSFLAEVPREIIEAAQIDGAGLRTEIFRVVLPIVLPGVAAAGLICFIFAWNEFFLANLLTTQVARTTPPVLGSFVDGRGQFLSVLSAASTIAIVPVVIAGWVAQKQLVRGLAMGAIK